MFSRRNEKPSGSGPPLLGGSVEEEEGSRCGREPPGRARYPREDENRVKT